MPLLSALIYPSLDLNISGSVSLFFKVFLWAHTIHSILPPQEAYRSEAYRSGQQGEEVCLGTQLTPHETVISLASHRKEAEGGRCSHGRSPPLWGWPFPSQGQDMGMHPVVCWT